MYPQMCSHYAHVCAFLNIAFYPRINSLTSNEHSIQNLSTLNKGLLIFRNHLPTTDFNLFSKTLTSNLYKLPTKLIDLKSLKSSAPHFFRIKTRKVEFSLLWNVPCRKNSSKEAIISSLEKSQQRCQKSMVKPSRLGALSPERFLGLQKLPPPRKTPLDF